MKPLLFGNKKPNFGHINSKAGRNYYTDDYDKNEEIEIIREITRYETAKD
jgi:hypothetical protein